MRFLKRRQNEDFQSHTDVLFRNGRRLGVQGDFPQSPPCKKDLILRKRKQNLKYSRNHLKRKKSPHKKPPERMSFGRWKYSKIISLLQPLHQLFHLFLRLFLLPLYLQRLSRRFHPQRFRLRSQRLLRFRLQQHLCPRPLRVQGLLR